MDQTKLAELKKQTTEFLKENKIWLSNSPCGSPIFFAKKKDEQLRLCVDYCALNKNMTLDSLTLPRIKEILTCLKGAQYCSHLDLRDGYFHVPIANEDVHKVAFFF